MTTFEEARQVLQKESVDGVSLYDHLAEVVLKILVEKPANASEAFEHLSVSVKEARAKKSEPVNSASRAAAKAAQLKWATSTQALFAVPDEPPEGGPVTPDLLDEANMWSWAGVSFGQLELYRLYLSIKKLALTLPEEHETLRFWGKITTRSGGDYTIIEGRAIEDQLGEIDPRKMEGTSGTNRYTYWVTRGADQPWVQLPPVTQAQIVVSRKIRRFFSGDLEAAVPGYPPFPGTEKNLLRAQIARIGAGCLVSPAGFFEVDEDSDPPAIKVAEAEAINEAFPKAIDDLRTVDGWVHHEMEINAIGRVRPQPEVEEGDEAAAALTVEEPDPIAPMRSLADDEENSWGFRVSPAGAGVSPNSMVVAKSLLWPGAYAVAAGKRFTCIYIGTGVKWQAEPFEIPMPPPLQTEWQLPVQDGDPEENVLGNVLVEQSDVLVDPTPPMEEEPEE